MKSFLASVFVVFIASSSVGCFWSGMYGVPVSNASRGYMSTQSGERVEVYQNEWNGQEYYYENGAKVIVNRTGGTSTGDRATRWSGDRP